MNFWNAYSKYLEYEKANTATKPTPKKKKTIKKNLELADDVLEDETKETSDDETEETSDDETDETGGSEDAD